MVNVGDVPMTLTADTVPRDRSGMIVVEAVEGEVVAHQHDARSIVDASGEALHAALAEGIYLVKPSRRELSELSGSPIKHLGAKLSSAGTPG